MICDSWTRPTRISIINFLVYCNKRVIFHKSDNAFNKIQDANYIENLIDTIRVGLQLMEKMKILFWTLCLIIKFIFNHHWVLKFLMQKYLNCEILRPRVTRFTINFITLKSIQQKR
ncbi:hypothetical protein B296_00029978 [Ensete ventricosum]|uniref:DUF659 domain-containing protein n=1 Tax=Ensete ventricosum TaxID=4639 RepID=A0A426Z5K3_ENSVE|nr:hypothetical protein B296_00029978 [Ensete ventricosum]